MLDLDCDSVLRAAHIVVVSRVIGALLMAYPIILIRLRSHPYFRQDR